MVHFLVFNTLLATFIGFSTSLVEEWVRYVDPEGQFEVFMPDSTTIQRTQTETPIGAIEYVVVGSNEHLGKGLAQYAVNYCNYPAEAVHSDSTELVQMLLQETVSSSQTAFTGEMLYAENMSVAGYPGKIWKMSKEVAQEGGKPSVIHMKCKALVAGNTFYCLQVIVPETLTVENNGDRFFNSFKLVRR